MRNVTLTSPIIFMPNFLPRSDALARTSSSVSFREVRA